MSRIRAEEGFTLSELLVVIVLMGMILGIAYGGLYVVNGGIKISDRQAHFAQEIAAPLDALERITMQQTRILNDPGIDPRAQQLGIYTDMDSDDHFETQFIQATADHRLIVQRAEEVDTPGTRTLMMSEHNYNVQAGVPLFTYFDAGGSEIPADEMNRVSSDASSVLITVVTVYDGEQFSDSRLVMFRN